MKSEKEKMLSGDLYKAFGKELYTERKYAKGLLYKLNNLPPEKIEERFIIIKELLGKTGSKFLVETPFRCDYGYNITIGENFYANYNLTILDCAPVNIGDNALIGPNVSIYTASHPLNYNLRNQDYELALPVNIGNNIWIGGNAIINPGVTIGDNSVIGAGSVVTKDIESDVVAVGNPCRVLRQITEEDKQIR